MMFNTIEEVKEFLTSTEINNLGAVVFIDESGEQMSIPFQDFIKKVGLQKAAEFIFDNQQQMKKVSIDKKELKSLMDRFIHDPDSLTDEEKIQAYMTIDSLKQNDSNYSKSMEFYEIITKFLVEDENPIFKSYNGLLAMWLTYIETALVSSSHLSQFSDNTIAMQEIVRDITSQIVIPEGIDEATLLLGLIHVIGERFITNSSSFNKMEVDYHKMIDTMGLTKAFMYECPSCKDGDCSTCNKKGTIGIKELDVDEIFDSLLDGFKSNPKKKTNAEDTKSAEVIDIRARLKKN